MNRSDRGAPVRQQLRHSIPSGNLNAHQFGDPVSCRVCSNQRRQRPSLQKIRRYGLADEEVEDGGESRVSSAKIA